MIIQVRINNNDNLMWKLCEWNSAMFADIPTLKLQTDDLVGIKNAFSEINKIEIFQANVLIAEYTLYDTYSSISYLGQVYVEHENIFADCLEVQLRRSSLVDQVKRIEDAINENIDIDAMTVSEYRQFMLKQVNDGCKQDIYGGTVVEINGEPQHFSFKSEDQINLLQLYLMSRMYDTITVLPYHSDGQTCMFYTSEQIKTIYITMIIRLISITTYTNQLHMYANTLTTKEELSNLRYGMELPEPYARVVADIVNETIAALGDIEVATSTEQEEGNENEEENTVGD